MREWLIMEHRRLNGSYMMAALNQRILFYWGFMTCQHFFTHFEVSESSGWGKSRRSPKESHPQAECVFLTGSPCRVWSPAATVVRDQNWATSWQNQQSDCASSEDSDQPGQLPSLIRVFTVHLMSSVNQWASYKWCDFSLILFITYFGNNFRDME